MSSNLEESLDDIRNSDRINEFVIAFKISAIQLIGPLFPVFCIVDYLLFKEHFYLFMTLRLSVTLFCFSMFYFSKNITKLSSWVRASLALILYPSLIITIMIGITSNISSVYFVGLNLIAAGAICFFPWRNFVEIGIVTSLVYLPYLFLPLFVINSQEDVIKFGVNCIFILGSIIISVVIRIIYEQLKFKEVSVRKELRQEIENRNLIISEKSKAAVRLSSLSKQFSPQVVQAIESGKLDIEKSLKRANICAIFIDIVNSTERVVRIDKDDLNLALSMFMEDTMSVLLKYDITIDKFLGDGVLAFSNAPLEQQDYVRRVVDAAIEIKAKIMENRNEYIDCWKNELEVKIGIDVGFANVGFYGSKEHFKSYTAIGSVINLSSRLCSIATPNQILISNEVYKCLKNEDEYKILDLGMRKIKGFENDIIKVFSIDSVSKNIKSNIPYCPDGHGILSLDVNQSGIYEFKCRSCSFILKENRSSYNKAS
jgi:adenylate cyclase